MNRPGIDTSSERLTMRINIEDEVRRIIVGCGFRRVVVGLECEEDDGGEGPSKGGGDLIDTVKDKGRGVVKNSRTAWNRSVQLYERHTE